MEYRRIDSGTFVIRLDQGDEIIGSLKSICRKEKVESALVSGLGACRKAEIAHYDTKEKRYHNKKFEGMIEIVSLTGNMASLKGEPIAHLHAALGLADFSVVGGHVVSMEVNPTCEIAITPLHTKIERSFDEKSGLNLLRP